MKSERLRGFLTEMLNSFWTTWLIGGSLVM